MIWLTNIHLTLEFIYEMVDCKAARHACLLYRACINYSDISAALMALTGSNKIH